MTVISQLFYDPAPKPLNAGQPMPLAQYIFLLSGTTQPGVVYQDAGLTAPYPTVNGQYVITADGTGAFPPIFLNPSTIYRVQLYQLLATGVYQLVRDDDPVIPAFPVSGTGPISLDAQGEVTIAAPQSGGTGVTLTINPPPSGQALKLVGSGAGNAALIANNAITVGTQTATFSATNKPGTGTTAPTKWLPISCDGSLYYIPMWL